MIFPYLKVTSHIKRPIIPFVLKSENTFIFYQALIDSGADYCIFSTEVAEVLGIKLSPRKKVSLKGIGKGKLYGHWEEIEIGVGSVHYKTKAIFAEISEFGHGILGQQGFFDMFTITFDLIREEIMLRERQIKPPLHN